MISFDNIWTRIKANEGNTFRQGLGQQFTYAVKGSKVVPSCTNQDITQADFKEASVMLPLKNSGPVQHLRGSSYIYTLLMDVRIRQKDW
jgi:hypothetical protein